MDSRPGIFSIATKINQNVYIQSPYGLGNLAITRCRQVMNLIKRAANPFTNIAMVIRTV